MEFMPPERLCRDFFSGGTQVKDIPRNGLGNLAVEGLDRGHGEAVSTGDKIERRLAAVAWVGNPSLKTPRQALSKIPV